MRSGWPSSPDDSGSHPAGQRQAPFGPETSWPGGYSGPERAEGDYRYPGQPGGQQFQPPTAYSQGAYSQDPQPHAALPPSPNYGEHPYAAYDGGYGEASGGYPQPGPDSFGYGDPGYSDPGYDGPSSQDAGVAGTRTVRGFVEPGYTDSGTDYFGNPRQSLPPAHGLPAALPAPTTQFAVPGYGEPAERSQPWDYSQPLRYEGDDPSLPGPNHPSGAYAVQGGFEPRGFGAGYGSYQDDGYPAAGPSHDDAARQSYGSGYNGSELSRPGIDGPGYDLSEIIGTNDFPEYGYDEPSVERLAYDDPRYDDGYGGSPSDGPYAGPGFDETRLDSFWPGSSGRHGARPQPAPSGDSLAGLGATRSAFESPSPSTRSGAHRALRSAETRLDLGYRTDQTSFDVPAYGSYGDETRMDMSAVAVEPARSATGLLAPERPVTWADETSLDSFAGLNLDEPPTGYRAEQPSRAVATALREVSPAPAKGDPSVPRGRRRGRSSDRRQWLALGAVVVVAAGAIGGVLSKFVFTGPSGPAHSISTPASVDGYTRNAGMERAVDINGLKAKVVAGSGGQATDVVSAVYSQGSTAEGSGSSVQMFMFVGGHLANSAPASSIASFEQTYPSAQVVPAGPLGGEAACVSTTNAGESVSMCVFFDNDSFGTMVSPSMSPATLATTMQSARPGLEHVTQHS